MIRGNLDGIKKVFIKALEDLYEMSCDKSILVSQEILSVICPISSQLGREISIYINRRGKVVDVAVGDSNTVSLTFLSEKRGEDSLSGIRCIHTHPGGGPMLSPVDVTALISMKFDCMAAIGVEDGRPCDFSFGYLVAEEGKIIDKVYIEGPYPIDSIENIQILGIFQHIEEQLYDKVHTVTDSDKERVILVGGTMNDIYSPQESLDELAELVETAGGEVLDRVIQNKSKIDKTYYIGSGKARELSLLRQSLMADSVVFDDELSGAQVRNLEEIIGCKVLDRTTLILDIFAQRAKSREGKIQVELAQLKYRLPRLYGVGGALSRTGGGIGTRGPGEKKIEIDKRHIRNRIYELENELDEMRKNREVQREKRKSNDIPVVSLVGYTNAGKSTLRNKLCEIFGMDKEKVFEANMLFATLDTTTRVVSLPTGKEILLSDTVGFIRKLPHDLVEAFKSTLEEITQSDLLIHLVDSSNKNAVTHIETVNSVLRDIGAGEKRSLLVFNKIDAADGEFISILRGKFSDAVEVSALQGINLKELLDMIEKEVYRDFVYASLLIPYSDGKIVSYLHDSNSIEKEEYREEGIYVEIKATKEVFGRVREYKINS